MTDGPNASSVVAKLTAVRAAVGLVVKDAENLEGRKFKYRSVDAVVNAVSQALTDQGVIIHSTSAELIASEQVTYGARSTLGFRTTISVEYEWTDGESSITSQVLAESIDSGDKGTSKAMSVAYRTAILQTLTLPTGARDPDADTYDTNEPGNPLADLMTLLSGCGFNRAVQGDIIVAAIGRQLRDLGEIKADEIPVAIEAIEQAIADRGQSEEQR